MKWRLVHIQDVQCSIPNIIFIQFFYILRRSKVWPLANSFSSERAEIHSGFCVKLLLLSVGNKAKVPATLKTKEAPLTF